MRFCPLFDQFSHARRHDDCLFNHPERLTRVIVNVEIYDPRRHAVMHIVAFRNPWVLKRACRIKHHLL